MKKISAILAGVVASVSLASAEGVFEGDFFNEGLFAGASVGYLKSKSDLAVAGFDFENYKDNVIQIQVKGGKKFGDSYGMNSFSGYIAYAYQTTAKGSGGEVFDVEGDDASWVYQRGELKSNDFKWSAHKFAIGADWTPRLYGQVSGVAGLYAGLAYENTKANAQLEVKDAKDNSVLKPSAIHNIDSGKFRAFYGVRVGALWQVDEKNLLELTYQYEEINSDTTNYGVTLGYTFMF